MTSVLALAFLPQAIAAIVGLLALIVVFVLSESTNAGFYIILFFSLVLGSLVFGWHVWILANLGNVLIGTLAYIGAGILWSFFKWYRYTRNESKIKIQKFEYNKFRSMPGNQSLSDIEAQAKFISDPAWNPLNFRYQRNLFNIHRWVIYWPLSIFVDICGDWLLNGLTYLIKSLGKIYDGIAGGTRNLP